MTTSSAVHRYRHALRVVVAAESKAYGFTLVIWGSGALTAAERGVPGATDVVAFVGGAMASIVAVIAATYRRPSAELQPVPVRQRASGAIHVFSVGLALALAWSVAASVHARWLAYGASGVVACLAYQLIVGLEVFVSTKK